MHSAQRFVLKMSALAKDATHLRYKYFMNYQILHLGGNCPGWQAYLALLTSEKHKKAPLRKTITNEKKIQFLCNYLKLDVQQLIFGRPNRLISSSKTNKQKRII